MADVITRIDIDGIMWHTYCWSNKLIVVCSSVSVVLMIVGLFIYPLGLNAKFVRFFCPSSRKYNAGACQIGWAYLLGIMGTALALFCPFLSQYTDMRLHGSRQVKTRVSKAIEATMIWDTFYARDVHVTYHVALSQNHVMLTWRRRKWWRIHVWWRIWKAQKSTHYLP